MAGLVAAGLVVAGLVAAGFVVAGLVLAGLVVSLLGSFHGVIVPAPASPQRRKAEQSAPAGVG